MALTDQRKEAFLVALRETGRIFESCETAGISYDAMDATRLHDKKFLERIACAQREHGEKWERACMSRGIDGWEEPVFGMQDGQTVEVGTKRRFSDRCLELGLKRNCPEYREKMQIDATISGGVLVLGPPVSEEEWLEKHGGKKAER